MSDRVKDHGDFMTIDVSDLAAEVVEGIEDAILAETGMVAER